MQPISSSLYQSLVILLSQWMNTRKLIRTLYRNYLIRHSMNLESKRYLYKILQTFMRKYNPYYRQILGFFASYKKDNRLPLTKWPMSSKVVLILNQVLIHDFHYHVPVSYYSQYLPGNIKPAFTSTQKQISNQIESSLSQNQNSSPLSDLELELPTWIHSRLEKNLSIDEYLKLTRYLQTPPINYVRPRDSHKPTTELTLTLTLQGVTHTLDPEYPAGWKIEGSRNLSTIRKPNSKFLIQDKGSLLTLSFLPDLTGCLLYDASCAPGMKAQYLALQYGATIRILGVDPSASRLRRMQDILAHPDYLSKIIHSILGDSRYPPIRKCDIALLDAPCTGTGTLQRDPDIMHLRDEKHLAHLVALQRELLAGIINWASETFPLYYITCSLLSEEGEDQIDWVLSQYPTRLLSLENILEPGYSLSPHSLQVRRIMPHLHQCQGFFVAAIQVTPINTNREKL